MQTYKQCSIKLEIGVNGVISQPAILGSIQSEALIQFLNKQKISQSVEKIAVYVTWVE